MKAKMARKLAMLVAMNGLLSNSESEEIESEISELERLAKIGRATEKAYSNGAFLIYDVVENDDGTIERYNCDETIEELLGWLGFTGSEE